MDSSYITSAKKPSELHNKSPDRQIFQEQGFNFAARPSPDDIDPNMPLIRNVRTNCFDVNGEILQTMV